MRTLYIIGNGFDLAHGLNTRYADFYEWLIMGMTYEESEFVASIEDFISGINLWSDFERALGAINTKEYMQYIIQKKVKKQPDHDDVKTAEDVCDAIECYFKYNYDYLIYDFCYWANSIDTIGIKPVFQGLKAKDHFFFTFNYTDTLEHLYGIPKKNILHIHGYAKTNPYGIIVGHDHDYQKDQKLILDILHMEGLTYNDEIVDKMTEALNLTFKNTNEIIHSQLDTFLRIGEMGIEKVIVIGHSYGKTDWQYFDILKKLCPNAQWELTCYTLDDLNAAYNINRQLSLHAIYSQIQDKYRKI